MPEFVRTNKAVGFLLVLLIHGAALYGLWSYRLLPVPNEDVTLFVNLINPPPPAEKKPEPPKPLPPKVKPAKPPPVTAPPQPILAANAQAISPDDSVAPQQPATPLPPIEAPSGAAMPEPVAAAPLPPPSPVVMTSDLSVACPERMPPEYPSLSRRLGEQGRVVLRVDLDEGGHVASARISESSGYSRLDEASLIAVKKWHCNAPIRNGETLRAVAMQPFNFVLEGRR